MTSALRIRCNAIGPFAATRVTREHQRERRAGRLPGESTQVPAFLPLPRLLSFLASDAAATSAANYGRAPGAVRVLAAAARRNGC